jgi:hypothetical protein
MSLYKVIFSLSLLVLISCFNEPNRPDSMLDQNTPTEGTVITSTQPQPTPATPNPTPAQNADGVWHYTCADGCEGGAATATACAGCGKTLVHNKAYHNNANTPTTTPTTSPTITTTPTSPPIQQPTTAPAQNAAGVWHYTCADGCSGGAGTQTACGGCGKTLVHNKAYHN